MWIALGFALGIVIENQIRFSAIWIFSFLGFGLVFLWFLRGRKLFLPLFVILLSCIGMLTSRLEAHVPHHAIKNHIGARRMTVTGIVRSLPIVKTHGKKMSVSFVFDASSVTKWRTGYRHKYRATGRLQVFLLQPPFVPEVGDELRLFGTLQAARQVLNPGEFDYAKYLEAQNIYAIFQTIGKRSVRCVRQGAQYHPMRILSQFRRALANLIDQNYLASEAAILQALVIGLRSEIAPDVRDHFMKTGTVHLLAISGLNITMIAGSFYLFFLFLKLQHRRAAAIAIGIVLIYVVLAGAGLPVQRAGYSSVLVLLGVMAGRPGNLLNILCFAFFIMLLWAPSNLWNIGFQLSFLSVLSLMVVLPMTTRFNLGALSIGSSLAVLLGTFPIVLYYFNIFSPVSILANLLAIPLFDAVLFMTLVFLVFHYMPFINLILIKCTSLLLGAGLAWIKYLSFWRWGYWFFEKPSLVQIIFYYSCMACFLFLRPHAFRYKKWLILGCGILWSVTTLSFFWKTGPETFRLTLFASGRNPIAHVRFSHGEHWLINAGRSFPSDQGEWLIAPYLRHLGVHHLKGILLTDLAKKNTGGLHAVVRDFPIHGLFYPENAAFIPEEVFKVFRVLKDKARDVRAGEQLGEANEKIQVVAIDRCGMAVLITCARWKILLISRIDPAFLDIWAKNMNISDIHAVILPFSRRNIPEKLLYWLDLARPLLVVLPDSFPALEGYLSSRQIPFVNLKKTGALTFKQRSAFLDLESFVMGKLGFYSYS